MNPKYSDTIKKIRETRQQKAAFELGSRNEMRDRVLATKSRMDRNLMHQTQQTQAQISHIYGQTNGRTHGLADLELLFDNVEKEKTKVRIIATECDKLKTLAHVATVEAEKAKIVHAALLRSYENGIKWLGSTKKKRLNSKTTRMSS